MTFRRWGRRGLRALVVCGATACAASRDSIPLTEDVALAGLGDSVGEAYVYVSTRPLASVGLVDARGLSLETARSMTDRVANALDACSTERGREGKLVAGAARVVARLTQEGTIDGVHLRTSEGPAATAHALLCLVSPLKLLTFPRAPASEAPRSFALEASWGASLSEAPPGVQGSPPSPSAPGPHPETPAPSKGPASAPEPHRRPP